MDAFNRMRLAQYHNRRGVRMLKCASGVESCRHREAFVRLAKECFEARDYQMRQARIELGNPKNYRFIVRDVDGALYDVDGFDELSAGAHYEQQCESVGWEPGDYVVLKVRERL